MALNHNFYNQDMMPIQDSFDEETNDVSLNNDKEKNEGRRGTWPKIIRGGPNINIKIPRRSFTTQEERVFFSKQIKLKQKTEDCYFKDTCSFAHGEHELRNKSVNTQDKYKTKPCKSFNEELYCNYGNRCQYCHTIKNKCLLKYKAILYNHAREILVEFNKEENLDLEMTEILNLLYVRKQFKIPRIKVLMELTD